MCSDLRSTIEKLRKELEAARRQIDLLREKNRKLEWLSITDELTGLYNQRHFRYMLEREVARNKRQGHPLCLLFLDVDGLKGYNDTYGHSVGDEVLRTVAQSLSGSIRRDVDSAYRYGGDEFVVILPEVGAKQAVDIARRINDHLAESDFQDVTLSIGVAEIGADMDDASLLRHADEAMYAAKRKVEDRIYVFEQGDSQ